MADKLKIGVLALQGAVEPHVEKLEGLGAEAVRVRRPEHLEGLSGLILPGGESTTMLHLLPLKGLWEPLREWVKTRPCLGVCAGAILLAREVRSPRQPSLAAMDVEAERNAYGRQLESFITPLTPTEAWPDPAVVEGVFIRAPRLRAVGPEARVLLRYEDEDVLIEQGHLMAASFHPELTDSDGVHKYFLEKCLA